MKRGYSTIKEAYNKEHFKNCWLSLDEKTNWVWNDFNQECVPGQIPVLGGNLFSCTGTQLYPYIIVPVLEIKVQKNCSGTRNKIR